MPPRPLTAAIFASSFYPHVGGVEELVRQLAAYQRTTNRQAAVATNRFPASLPAFEVREDTPIHRYAFVAPRRHPLRWLEAMRSRGPLARRIAEDMRAYAPDVIHVQCVSVNAWYAEQVARQLGVPLVVTLQGELTMDAHNIYAQSRFLRTSLRRLLHEADAVTACSEYVLREAEAFGDVSLGARGFVVHNGVSVADFDVPARQSDRRYVLAIGRLVAEKGFDVLLRAFSLARAETAFDLQLLIAGDGPARAQLRALTTELALDAHVDWLGVVRRPEVPALFRGASIVSLPSRREPFGIVNLEAMASGVPLIASSVGGVPEIVRHETNGLLVNPEDARALADALLRLEADHELAAKLVAGGRLTAADHDWSRVGAEYDRVYEFVAGR